MTSTRATVTARSRPIRAASRWAGGAKKPMHSKGNVVRAPAAAPESPRSSWIVPMRGGTEVIGVRRLRATATTPATSSTG